jgi:hypothetical protein
MSISVSLLEHFKQTASDEDQSTLSGVWTTTFRSETRIRVSRLQKLN